MTAAAESVSVPQVAQRRRRRIGLKPSHILVHAVLLGYTFIALSPVILIFMNSVKERTEIFGHPLHPPGISTFDTSGYSTVWEIGNFVTYFKNSLIVTVASLALVLLLSALAAFGLTEYDFRGNLALALFFALGIMIPIRLGTVSILREMQWLTLTDTLYSLILVYTAMGIPLGVFLLSQFQRQVPTELKNAARIDGAGEFRVFWLTVPLIRPGLAAVAVFTMLPVWNDLWFPLILAPGEETKTVTLGAQQFLGQYAQDWNAVLASLSLAALPIIILYVIFSRQFLRGLTQGALK